MTNHDHDKYITTQEFIARLKQANLASKNDIANFVKNNDFDNKLKDVTSNKNELMHYKKVKAISTKGLTKDFIKNLSIPNGAKYFFRNISKLFSIYTS